MPLVKHCANFIKQHVLRRSCAVDTQGQSDNRSEGDDAARTLRTYPAGGDLLNDRVEFHLGNGPGGFR